MRIDVPKYSGPAIIISKYRVIQCSTYSTAQLQSIESCSKRSLSRSLNLLLLLLKWLQKVFSLDVS